MLRYLIYLLAVLGLGLAFAWVADNPGTVFLKWDWLATQLGRPGEEVGLPLSLVLTLLIALIVVIVVTLGIFRGIIGMPSLLSRVLENRRREKGYRALSQGLIAASSGDADTARSLAKESGKLLGDDPLVSLLGTQTALLEGKRDEARQNFQKMLSDDTTRMVALRGLFLEAERQGSGEAARHYAEEASKEAPSLPWAGMAKLRYQASDEDWDASLKTLEANRAAGLIDREGAKRQRAVLLTAKALGEEQADPETARKLARDAHKLAKDLVPAATTYARCASRLGDIGGATKVVEASWKISPHPELAEAYATVRPGDSTHDRLKRARRLSKLKPNHPESNLAVAVAAIDAKEWEVAREALKPILTTLPTERACLLMADIEEGQHGDKGRMRDWLSRAVRASADPVWIADGYVSEDWMPVSPISGEIDAFEWKEPVAQLGERDVAALTVEEFDADTGPILDKEAPLSTVEESSAEEVAEDAIVIEDQTEAPDKGSDDASQSTSTDAETQPTPPNGGDDPSDKPAEKDGERGDEGVAQAQAQPETQEDYERNNVVSLDSSRNTEEDSSGVPAGEADATQDAPDTEKPISKDGKLEKEFDEKIALPLERRPDDPGVRPETDESKPGFKLFK